MRIQRLGAGGEGRDQRARVAATIGGAVGLMRMRARTVFA